MSYIQPETLSSIIIHRRSRDWHAALNGDARLWGCGATIPDAIGSAIHTHADLFGIEVETVQDHMYQLYLKEMGQ